MTPTTAPTRPPIAFPIPDCSVSEVGTAEWISVSELPGVSRRILAGGRPALTRFVAARSAAEEEPKIPTTVFIESSRTDNLEGSKIQASDSLNANVESRLFRAAEVVASLGAPLRNLEGPGRRPFELSAVDPHVHELVR